MSSLDIGAGNNPRGSVNIDKRRIKAPNAIKADSHFLPFKSKSFAKVFCFHVLEHVKNPYEVLKEIRRVCYGQAFLKVPSKFHTDRGKEHIYSWTTNTLTNLLSLLFENVKIHYTNRLFFYGGRKLSFLNGLLLRLGFSREILAIVK